MGLGELLSQLTVEGTLYEKLPDNAVRCYACGHRCLIREGREGICRVRFNRGGKLYVPHGYVAALQVDPTEKKPFFHILPGSSTLTFGMLGCDLHCAYCFTGDTPVVTDRGLVALAELFDVADNVQHALGADIAHPIGYRAVTATGSLQAIRAVFKHPYSGKLLAIKPYYLPALQCTPDHHLYATDDPSSEPQLIPAHCLTQRSYLAIPRKHGFSTPQVIDVVEALEHHQTTYRVTWDLTEQERRYIDNASTQGKTSREIGAVVGKSGSYIRHVRRKLAHGHGADTRTSGPLVEDNRIRFPHERQPGLPLAIDLNVDLARLLGYYCAEGSVTSSKRRPNSHVLSFSFSHDETDLVEEVRRLLREQLTVDAAVVQSPTTRAVVVNKASVALLFKSLAGSRASGKRVPVALLDAPRPIVEAFIAAYVAGDGHHYANGKFSATTVSRDLAYGVAWLVLKLGYLPSVYDTAMSEAGTVQGRAVRRSPHQYTVVWYVDSVIPRRAIETEQHFLIPVREITATDYDGDVYNMEVEGEHSYLAGFCAVSNCQNWLTSQTLRDEEAGVAPQVVTPEQMVSIGKRYGAQLFGSSYNEPLITAEWAVDVFKAATQANFRCVYISNGNATPEVLDYLQPYLTGYKIDLKSMNDKNYRRLGTTLNNVLDGIKMVHARGIWTEIVTLVIPGFNDSNDELWDAARFIASISPDIPWHVTAFHKDYKMLDPDNTTADDLIRAAEIGAEAGLHYVYAGNLPGRTRSYENTYCPNCGELLVERVGYRIRLNKLSGRGTCPRCSIPIPGIWK
jgi:pyruvate formate lyase activating enzyme